MSAIILPFTIWRFLQLDETIVFSAHYTEPFEPEHEYQRVVARISAYNPEQALEKYFKSLTNRD